MFILICFFICFFVSSKYIVSAKLPLKGKTIAIDAGHGGKDVLDVVRRFRKIAHCRDVQRANVRLVILDHLFRKRCHGDPAGIGLIDQFVVHVRNINDEAYVISIVHEVAFHRIKDHRPDHVSDVARFVDRWTAEVHADLIRPRDGREFFFGF